MAQYLDNDEDGNVDDQLVLDKMLENKAFMVMWKNENDLDNIVPPSGREGQDLGNDETHPEFVSNGRMGEFDASLEEVLHIINFAGHSAAYPDTFGLNIGSDLANAMDIARGGQFMKILILIQLMRGIHMTTKPVTTQVAKPLNICTGQ